jgi:FixJ family two-component response regulator
MRARSLRTHDAAVNPPPGNRHAGVDRQGRVVILVEDDAALRAALERLLRASGFEAQAYDSAEAALALQGDWADCLVVVDLNLPKTSGLDLIDRLRGRGLTAPAVVITAHDELSVRREVRRRGIEHFLAKPFPGRALVLLLDDVIAANSDGARSG